MTNLGVAFIGCTSATTLSIGDGIEEIPDYCFKRCEKLQSVRIGKAVRKIGEKAFEGNERITEIYACSVVPPTCYDKDVFDSYVYKAATVYVPNERNAIERYRTDNVWRDFFEICSKDMTSIHSATIGDSQQATYLNLNGQRTTGATRGLNIVNGNKVLAR